MATPDVIVGWNPSTRTWSVQRGEPATVALPEDLVGTLTAADAWLRWGAEDFGHLVHDRPRAVCRPTAPEQIAPLLAWVSEQRITVAPRGAGHSVAGQAQAAGGIVLDMSQLALVEDVAADRMTVQAGTEWTEVLHAALARRLTPPVLTDYLFTSVGGTLSVGGIGGASHRWGAQVDQVHALEVATPQGVTYWCSRHNNPELFDIVRSGHGQIGVITRAVLALARAPDQVCWRRLHYRDLETYLADHRRCATEQRFDYLEGQIQPGDDGSWSFMLEAVSYWVTDARHAEALTDDLHYDRVASTTEWLPYVDFADRMAPGEAIERATGAWLWPHPWATAFIPDSRIRQLGEETLALIRPEDLGVDGVGLLYPVLTEPMSSPLLRLPDEPIVWLMALLRKAPPDRPDALHEWEGSNREFLRRVLDHHGCAYQINHLPLSTSDWQEHFADQWSTIRAAKEEHDPQCVLTPGQRMFSSESS